MVFHAYCEIDGGCQTSKGIGLVIGMVLSETSGHSVRGPSLNPLGAGLLHEDSGVRTTAYETLRAIEEYGKSTEHESGSGGGGGSSELDVGKCGVWWILKMNPFLLASYNRRKKAASLLLRSAAVGV